MNCGGLTPDSEAEMIFVHAEEEVTRRESEFVSHHPGRRQGRWYKWPKWWEWRKRFWEKIWWRNRWEDLAERYKEQDKDEDELQY